MTDLAIDAHGLRKEFGDKVAVADFTLKVTKGEIFGFLGPNGAGKTTSVKMMLGLIEPTSGIATLLGKPLADRLTRAKIGFLPEHFRFHEWLRAAEFLDLHGRLYGMPASRRAEVIPQLLELVGLSHRADTKLSKFSKGMLQRIGLAQSLLNEPELVFLDEPTSGLDPLGRRLVRDIIKELRSRQITVFLNSHLLSEIELTCDRVAFIRNGEIIRVATLEELQQQKLRLSLRIGQPDQALFDGMNRFGTDIQFNKGDGLIQMTVEDEARIPELVKWLVEQEFAIYELNHERQSLEDQFLEIVGAEMYDA